MSVEWMPVQGDSMWPSLKAGDDARLRPLPEGPLSPGDVVVARLGGSFVIHRVVREREGRVLLQGDNCERPDPEVERAAVLACVREIRRGGRVLPKERWDRGPHALGLWRIQLKRRLVAWLGARRGHGGTV